MARFLHDLPFLAAERSPGHEALVAGKATRDYEALAGEVRRMASALAAAGLARHDRVAIFLDKRIETIVAMFAVSAAGGIFVPVNPVLKPAQVGHILADSGAALLISSKARIEALGEVLSTSPVRLAISVDGAAETVASRGLDALLGEAGDRGLPAGPRVDNDVAALFYTSGSTGRPKGVVLSHRNLVVGGESVAEYLGNCPADRILSLLPLSFDAGFSQITTAFHAGATLVLHNYLLPREVPRLVERHAITGLTCVPPLWMQLLEASWAGGEGAGLRYIANTGGRMPREVLGRLRRVFPNARPFLMYGLTEAFRSTYLDPDEVDRRPDSIGKAIPNAEILVVRPDGKLAGPGEEGELVHRGPLVGLGYWNDPERTAERYRPAPGRLGELPLPEPSVWSGDIVRIDEEGFLYFVGRNDDMIKTSGYRVSPAEVEEVLFASGMVREAAALGIAHPVLGQEIVACVVPAGEGFDADALLGHCAGAMARFMVPARIEICEHLPRSPNGKIDRKALAAGLAATGPADTRNEAGRADS